MNKTTLQNEAEEFVQPPISPNNEAETPPAWTMIENGRYQPRRIKGSCLGRELG